MIEGFQTVLAASNEERRDLFVGTADRLRTNEQNIEKDFWVCWTLDALFNGLEAGGPRLLFKGGTSLSKGYGLIERFLILMRQWSSSRILQTTFRISIWQSAMSPLSIPAVLSGIKSQSCTAYAGGGTVVAS
jgi:hypothetical protein